MAILSNLLRFRFVWLNLLFIGYLWWVQPAVLQHLLVADENGQPDIWLGGILLSLQVIELIGLLLKRPVSAYYARHYPNRSDGGGYRDNINIILGVFTPVFHIGLSGSLVGQAFELMGLRQNFWLILCLFVVLFKEAIFTVLLLSMGSIPGLTVSPPTTELGIRLNRWFPPPSLAKIRLKDALKDILGDLLLLIFSTLVYTASWEFSVARSSSPPQESDLLTAYLGISIFFFMVYFTTRAVYLMQEITIQQNRTMRILSWGSFLAVWLTALWTFW